MNTANFIFTAVAAIFAVVSGFGVLLAWVNTNPEKRAEALAHVRAMSTYTFRFTVIIVCVTVVLISCWDVIQFGRSDAPLRRRDILQLAMNFWNFTVYIVAAIGLPAYWLRKSKAEQRYRADAQT
ncbi:hypothetical protein [Pseudomonas sp. nanlin1]|uniref:hypothetical protein n=1 Tax=Pseudomonas sp. nanlin1 TaxID=3040605 RepID=UPI00388E2592